jgi:FixJ family two-component response regulator
MSDIDFRERLISERLSTPIIFMSAHSTEALARRITEAGAVAFLRKPLKAETLIEHLGKVFKTRVELG